MRSAALAAAVTVGAACASGQPVARGGHLEARWGGTDTARFSGAAIAERCDSLGLLEIRAMAGDTGVALAIYRRGGPAPGRYPVRAPDVADTTPPAGAVALRWFTRTAVRGFRSDSGEVVVERAPDGAIAGRFSAGMRAVTDSGRLHVSGTFANLQLGPAQRGCGRPRTKVDSVRGAEPGVD